MNKKGHWPFLFLKENAIIEYARKREKRAGGKNQWEPSLYAWFVERCINIPYKKINCYDFKITFATFADGNIFVRVGEHHDIYNEDKQVLCKDALPSESALQLGI